KPTELSDFRKKVHKINKTVVFTAGGWDLLHVGQMRYLKEAKSHADVLVVGVESNEAIRAVKGPNKPILDQWIRAESLAFLKSVDFITIIPIPSCQPTLELLQPDMLVSVKEDYTRNIKSSPEYKTVNDYGGKVVLVDRQSPFVSATSIIERMIGSHFGEIFEKYIARKNKPISEKFSPIKNGKRAV
ncbi:MAG: adenylyltransferase/cytidyltransferase family protein, partial [Patescibacteria group bacterium]|nr:adenylyltransferase/cytidyltransferase family protein [Patescibacteria group bacterium]